MICLKFKSEEKSVIKKLDYFITDTVTTANLWQYCLKCQGFAKHNYQR